MFDTYIFKALTGGLLDKKLWNR